MNIVLIISAVIFLFGVFNGLRKGLIRSVFSTFILVAALAVAAYSGPYAAKFLKTTIVYDRIYEKIESSVAAKAQEKISMQVGEQVELIQGLPLPETIKSGMLEHNHTEMYDVLGVETFAAYVSDYISMLIINALSYVVMFIAAYIVLKLICLVMDKIVELPILNGLNRFGGMLFGICNGIMGVWLLYIVITAFAATTWGEKAMMLINENQITSFIYNHNYLIEIIKNISEII